MGLAETLSLSSMELDHGAWTQSFVMILVSEVGDKTFLIAAILAMRHPRLLVFLGAFGSLVVMSVLSASMGHFLPALVPRRWTQALAGALFLVFGVRMLLEARGMQSGSGRIEEEMREVQEEIGADGDDAIPLESLEEGHAPPARPTKKEGGSGEGWADGLRNFCALVFGPVFVQAFVLTFLGEWGDRSQIATIALAAAHNVYVVALGTVMGHSLCTAVAVLAGRYLATKISVKHVTLGGACLFLLFGVIYFYEAWIGSSTEHVVPLRTGDVIPTT